VIDAAAAQWKSNGWVLVEGLVPADDVAAALAEIPPRDKLEKQPTGSTRRSDQPPDSARFRSKQFDGTTLFPYPDAPRLNRLFVHPAVVGFAKAALETDDLRIYQARVWSKYGDHTNYEQPLHLDRNHSLVPVRQGPGWGHVECFLYLHDVGEQTGAPRAVPADIAGRNGLGLGEGLGGSGTSEGPVTRDQAPHLYEGERSAAGQAGSLFAYRSDVWHRGVDIPFGVQRHIAAVSFRPANVSWINFDASGPLVVRPDFVAFAEQCTPDELALFDVPRPGHEFWTSAVLDAMQRTYPGLDLGPWRDALG
jgi:hypothetical protein